MQQQFCEFLLTCLHDDNSIAKSIQRQQRM